MMSDRLDDLTGELVTLAMKRGADPREAVATLMTAGFLILVSTVGREEAAQALREIADTMVKRVAD